MEAIREIFSIPFGYLIGFLYEITNNYIVSLLFMTIVVKLVILPSTIKQQTSMAKSQRLQPKIRRIKEKYATNKQKQQEEMNALYQREGYSSMTGGCLPTLITLPIMMGVYAVNYKLLSFVLRIDTDIIDMLKEKVQTLSGLTSMEKQGFRLEMTAISHWEELKGIIDIKDPAVEAASNKITSFVNGFEFLGMNLVDQPSTKVFNNLWIIPIATGLLSLAMAVYSYIRQRKLNPEMAKNPSMGCMTFVTPAMSVWFSFMFPASVGLYIIMSTALSLIQMIIINMIYTPKKVLAKLMIKETINQRAREKVLKRAAGTADTYEE
ncbi:MAG: YidC/Oxa1 family membrane protein insertase [Clostridiales bacterium]|nr:YidC/Oxa1 family membrane protein insertase [Clostridiales bacterium]